MIVLLYRHDVVITKFLTQISTLFHERDVVTTVVTLYRSKSIDPSTWGELFQVLQSF